MTNEVMSSRDHLTKLQPGTIYMPKDTHKISFMSRLASLLMDLAMVVPTCQTLSFFLLLRVPTGGYMF